MAHVEQERRLRHARRLRRIASGLERLVLHFQFGLALLFFRNFTRNVPDTDKHAVLACRRLVQNELHTKPVWACRGPVSRSNSTGLPAPNDRDQPVLLHLPQEIIPVRGEHDPSRIKFHQCVKATGIAPFLPRSPHKTAAAEYLARIGIKIVADNRVVVFGYRIDNLLEVLRLAHGQGLVVDAPKCRNIANQLANGSLVGNELYLVVMNFVEHLRLEVHEVHRAVPEIFQDDFALGLDGKRLPFLFQDDGILDQVEPLVDAHFLEPSRDAFAKQLAYAITDRGFPENVPDHNVINAFKFRSECFHDSVFLHILSKNISRTGIFHQDTSSLTLAESLHHKKLMLYNISFYLHDGNQNLKKISYQSFAGLACPRRGFQGLRSPFCSSKSFRSCAASSGVISPICTGCS